MRMQDRDLVAAIIAGDRAALAAAYDRYASALYAYCRTMLREPEDAADALQDTFVVAAQKLGGLRDPDRFRPWLYAVARNECLRRARARQATVDLEQAGEVSDDGVDVDAGLREADVRGLIWAAIQGLNAGEREVFELNVRHELEGADLAAALGVSANHAHALLSRARGQLEKSLGALLVARTGRRDCTELAAVLGDWDGELTPLLRKRVNRHVEQCAVCGERKRRELRPEALLGALPVLLLPTGLRAKVMGLVSHAVNLPNVPSAPGSAPPGSGAGPNTGSHSGPGRHSSSHSGSGRHSASHSDANSRSGSDSTSTSSSGSAGIGGFASAGISSVQQYCRDVARRAEPFDRDGFPVPLHRRRRPPLVPGRRRSVVGAGIALLLLLGVGGYTALHYFSPTTTAASITPPSPSQSQLQLAVDPNTSIIVQISTGPPSPSASSGSPSRSVSPSPSVTQIIVVRTSARPSRSPSRSPSPLLSPSPPPPVGTLIGNPTLVVATLNDNNSFEGTFQLIARGGPVPGYTIILPSVPPSFSQPSAAPASDGPMTAGQSDAITVYNIQYGSGEVLYTIAPSGTQAPFVITISPSYPVIG